MKAQSAVTVTAPPHWRGGVARLAAILALMTLLAAQTGCAPLPWQRAPVTLDGRPVIVCLGDSLTAGDAAPSSQSYPAWLQRRLDAAGYRYQVVNAGVSGDRVADGLARLQSDALALHPAIAIVELGSNDPGHTPQSVWAAGLARIVQRLQARHVAVILGGLDEPGMGASYRAIAARFRVPLVWFTAGLWSRPGLWGDAHHPNGAGYHVVADSFWPALRPLLRR